MAEELGDSKLPTSGSASLLKVNHCGIQFPYDLCVARPHTVAAVKNCAFPVAWAK